MFIHTCAGVDANSLFFIHFYLSNRLNYFYPCFIMQLNPKGFGFGVVRKPAKKQCDFGCIESATIGKCAKRFFYCHQCPAWSGGRQLYNRVSQRLAGSCFFVIFLTHPTANFLWRHIFFKKSSRNRKLLHLHKKINVLRISS